jgi:hypothetical protein
MENPADQIARTVCHHASEMKGGIINVQQIARDVSRLHIQEFSQLPLQAGNYEDMVDLLATAIEATSLGHFAHDIPQLVEDLPQLKENVQYASRRLAELEDLVSTMNPRPDVIGAEDPELLKCRLFLQRQKEVDKDRKWDTPSEQKKRARQLETLRATAAKLDVQRQFHWQKAHEVYAKALALEEICREDNEEKEAAAASSSEVYQIQLQEQQAIELARQQAAKRLQALKESRKRPRFVGASSSSIAPTEIMADDESEDLFAGM